MPSCLHRESSITVRASFLATGLAVGADMIRPNTGRLRRAVVETLTGPVAPAISRHVAGLADRLSALQGFAFFVIAPAPFGL